MFKKLSILLCLFFAGGVFAGDFTVRGLKLNHPDGFYQKGEEIVVKGTLLKAGNPAPDYKIRVNTIWESKKIVATQDFPCDGKPFKVSFTSDKPGWTWCMFYVRYPDIMFVRNRVLVVLHRC